MPTRRRLRFALPAALVAVLLAADAARGQDVGYVAEVTGAWTLRTPGGAAVPVRRVMAVPPRGVLVPPRVRAPGDRVRVVMRDGRPMERVCPPDRCAPLVLPPRVRVSTPAQRLAAGAGRLLAREPRRFVSLFSRGSVAAWRDGVAVLNADGVRLDSLLTAAPPGRYALIFRPLDSAGGPAAALVEAAWDPAAPAPVPVPGLRPGLYVMEGHAPGVPGSAGTACVLVRPTEGAAADQDRFAQAQRLVRGWGADAATNAAREFLCASLDLLAR
ncbi:MAG TPA: hypothetical protein VFT45_01955, partial [Longimicrobium sp.]|nr:hypothetical protein [Longimicrobium sp.]